MKKSIMLMNSKVILRVMRNNDMLAQIRRKTPYMRYKRDAYKYNNLLNRKFAQERKNCFWATDITYIPTAKGNLFFRLPAHSQAQVSLRLWQCPHRDLCHK